MQAHHFDVDTFTIEPNDRLCIDAKSFTASMYELLPWLKNHKPLSSSSAWGEAISLGDRKKFGLRPFPTAGKHFRHRFDFTGYDAQNTLDVYPGGRRACVYFDAEVNIPVIADNGDVVMSYTPMEILSMRQGWKRARGHVLVGGLGLGIIARKALMKKTVKHVTVVEIDKAVIDLVGPSLKEDFGDRVTILHSDVYRVLTGLTDTLLADALGAITQRSGYLRRQAVKTVPPTLWDPATKYDSVLLDIWNGVSGKYDDGGIFEHLSATHKHVWGWGYKLYNNSRY